MVKVVVVGKEWGMALESLLIRWAGDLKISFFLNTLPYGALNLRPFLTYGAQPTARPYHTARFLRRRLCRRLGAPYGTLSPILSSRRETNKDKIRHDTTTQHSTAQRQDTTIRQDKVNHDNTTQHKDKTHDKTRDKHDKASKTRQDKTRHDARQGNTIPDKRRQARQEQTRQDETRQHHSSCVCIVDLRCLSFLPIPFLVLVLSLSCVVFSLSCVAVSFQSCLFLSCVVETWLC
jgi:hypothetical protein